MAEEIDLNAEEEAALDAAWASVANSGKKNNLRKFDQKPSDKPEAGKDSPPQALTSRGGTKSK